MQEPRQRAGARGKHSCPPRRSGTRRTVQHFSATAFFAATNGVAFLKPGVVRYGREAVRGKNEALKTLGGGISPARRSPFYAREGVYGCRCWCSTSRPTCSCSSATASTSLVPGCTGLAEMVRGVCAAC